MAMIETTETPEDVERLLTKAREQLQAFEDAVDNKRLLARVKRSNPAHWVLLARAGFLLMGLLFFALVFVVIGLAFLHNPSARVLEGIQKGLGIPGGVPVASLAVSLSMFVAHLAMTFLAHNIGRNSPMLPWEAKEHQKLVNEVTRLTTQKAVMERIRQTPGGARPRISTPVPMSMRSNGPGALGGRGGFGGASMPPYAAGANQPSGGGFGERAPSVPPYAASQPPAGGFGSSPAPNFGGGASQGGGFGGGASQGGGFGGGASQGGGFGGGASQGGGFGGGASQGGRFGGGASQSAGFGGGQASGPNFGGGTQGSGFGGGRAPSGGFGAPDAYGGDAPSTGGGGGLLSRARAGGSGPNFGGDNSGFQSGRAPSNPPAGFSAGGGFGQRGASDPGFSSGSGGFGQRAPSNPGYGNAGFGGAQSSGFGQSSSSTSGFGQPSGGSPSFGQPAGGSPAFGQQPRGLGGSAGGFGQASSGFSGPGEATFEDSRPTSAGVRLGAATRGGTPLGAKPRSGGGLGTPRLAAPMGFPGTPEPPPRRVEYEEEYEDEYEEEELPEPVGDAPARIGIQMGVKKARPPKPDPGIALDVGDIVETMSVRSSFMSEDAPTQPMETRERGLPHWGRIDAMWLEEAIEKAENMVLAFPEQALLEFSNEEHLPFTLVIERATPAMAVRAMVAYVEFLASICTPPKASIRLVNVAHLDRSFHRNVDAALQPYFAGKVRVENNPGQVDIIFSEPDPNWDAYPLLPIHG